MLHSSSLKSFSTDTAWFPESCETVDAAPMVAALLMLACSLPTAPATRKHERTGWLPRLWHPATVGIPGTDDAPRLAGATPTLGLLSNNDLHPPGADLKEDCVARVPLTAKTAACGEAPVVCVLLLLALLPKLFLQDANLSSAAVAASKKRALPAAESEAAFLSRC